MPKKILDLIKKHKFIAGLIGLALLGGGFWGYSKINGSTAATRYISSAAEKGTLIVSVSGSGQISASSQIDVKAKASGDLINVPIKNGQEVKAGALLAQINATEAYQSLRDAQDNLANARLSMEKLMAPADALSILQAENSLAQAHESKIKAQDSLVKAYDDGFNDIANAFLELPTIMSGLRDILYSSSNDLGGGGVFNIDFYAATAAKYDYDNEKTTQYRTDAADKYQAVRAEYNKNFEDYKIANRFSDNSVIESLLDESYATTKNIAEAIKSADNFIQFYRDKIITYTNRTPPTTSNTHLSSLNTYTGKTNTYLSNLLSAKHTINNSKETIINSGRAIAEKTESLAKLKAGPDELDIRSQEMSIRQKQTALASAQQKLADYSARAPFDGVVAETGIKKGGSISAGATVATLITRQKIAEISLNEVDIAKVKAGQKATLTFDAVPDLSITGEVVEVDTLGAVSSGVVSYGVKITFDVQDERIKSGMSMSVNIVIESKPNVLLVPISAVKTAGDESYVQILVNGAPRQKTVTTGLSSDTQIEITDGLAEGDQIITQTITGASIQTGTTGSGANRSTGDNNNAIRGMMQLGGGGGGPPR